MRSLCLLLLAACSQPPSTDSSDDWSRLRAEITTRYPEVSHLDTVAIDALLADRTSLIIDVRAPQEFAVSHLNRAQNVTAERLLAQLDSVAKDRPILVYCSVGYRSAAAARQLSAAGYHNVHNYLGSIFAWANAGRPLVDAQGPTADVHPYDSSWGKLVRAELHRYRPRQ